MSDDYTTKLVERMKLVGHPGIASDELRREGNIAEHGENALCSQCDGTGNEFYSMFRKCTECHGTGLNAPARGKLYADFT